jgi:hypothetical protein
MVGALGFIQGKLRFSAAEKTASLLSRALALTNVWGDESVMVLLSRELCAPI